MRLHQNRIGWLVAAVLAVTLTVVLVSGHVGVVLGGDQPPPNPLEPPGPPADTMQTLADLPPHWSRILPADDGSDPCESSRFSCVLDGAAVLDRTTGLVWQRFTSPGNEDLNQALNGCTNATFGASIGGRFPSLAEFRTLIDPNTLALPDGHPFEINTTEASIFWTSDTDFGSGDVRIVAFDLLAPMDVVTSPKNVPLQKWCVRGPGGSELEDPDRIPSSWSNQMSSENGCLSERFLCSTGFGQILDRETGLLWEEQPSATTRTWADAYTTCLRTHLNRGGWRLPTADELETLIVFTPAPDPALPEGSPFNVGASNLEFWTSTVDPADPTKAFTVPLVFQGVGISWLKSVPKDTLTRAWCVRGPGE